MFPGLYNSGSQQRNVHGLAGHIRSPGLLAALILALLQIYIMQVIDHSPAKYKVGDEVTVSIRYPIGHYRVPFYLRGKKVTIIRILGRYINPEEEAFGRNAGSKLWCYMVCLRQKELWPAYSGDDADILEVEVFEPWLEQP